MTSPSGTQGGAAQDETGTLYDVFGLRDLPGGKAVRVFGGATGDLQARAAAAGDPLSAFVVSADAAEVRLRVFTPTREQGERDSASVAALSWLWAQRRVSDLTEVVTEQGSGPASAAPASAVRAQLCGGEWLLQQGEVGVAPADLDPLGALAGVQAAHIASTGRPNLMAEVGSLDALDAFVPDEATLRALGQATGTTGLVLYALAAPPEGPQRRADVSFRAFGPLRGFLEDAASSNMLACLTGTLLARGLTPPDSNMLRAAQRCPGQPALLSAQFGGPGDAVWVGGAARPRLT